MAAEGEEGLSYAEAELEEESERLMCASREGRGRRGLILLAERRGGEGVGELSAADSSLPPSSRFLRLSFTFRAHQ